MFDNETFKANLDGIYAELLRARDSVFSQINNVYNTIETAIDSGNCDKSETKHLDAQLSELNKLYMTIDKTIGQFEGSEALWLDTATWLAFHG